MSNPTRRHAGQGGSARGKTARYVDLRLQRLDDGRIRVSTPQARGWADTAKGPDQLWHKVMQAFVEATVAGYATWRGVRYDLDELTDPTDPTEPARRRPHTAREAAGDCSEVSYAQGAIVRPDQAHPAEWTPNPDGSWTSRKGRRYSDPAYIQSLLIKRGRMGLPTTYEEWLISKGEAS